LEMQESSRKASDATNSSKFPRAEIYYPQKTLCGHSDSIHSVQFSADGKTLASGSWDTTIKIWSAAGLILQTLSGHSLMIYSVAFSPNGRKIASGSADQTIKLWDAASG
jgi:WD40 repeat protein